MSNRPCNFCSYQDMKRRAKKDNQIIEVRPSTGKLGGVDVYRLNFPGQKLNKKTWIAWFMELPDRCAC